MSDSIPSVTSDNAGGPKNSVPSDKVVVQFGQDTLKGYTDRVAWSAAKLTASAGRSPLIYPVDEQPAISVDLLEVKAVFFVHTFDGPGHNPILFHDNTPQKEALWVRLIFQDGERVEAILENSREFLLHDVLSLAPFDPEGNNQLIICAKAQIREFHVLGVRSLS